MSTKKKVFILSIVLLLVIASFLILRGCSQEAKRTKLNSQLSSASTVEECESLSEELVKIPSCSWSFGTRFCMFKGSFYGLRVAECIGGIAARQDNSGLCNDNERNEKIVMKTYELTCRDFGEEGRNGSSCTEILAMVPNRTENHITTIQETCEWYKNNTN